ncbi:MAG TPA: hypothetical protein VJV78_49015 [Polyangiales bacterium]|nr:hypothetical protein [Polyangiales bacterium]
MMPALQVAERLVRQQVRAALQRARAVQLQEQAVPRQALAARGQAQAVQLRDLAAQQAEPAVAVVVAAVPVAVVQVAGSFDAPIV